MNKQKIRVLQITDMHLFADNDGTLLGLNTQASFDAVIDMVIQEDSFPDLILLTGDLSHDGSSQSYQKIAKSMALFSCPIYWIPGNHDTLTAMKQVLPATQLKNEREIFLDQWQLILLDSLTEGKVEGEFNQHELFFLETCLTKQSTDNAMIVLHHHPIPIGCKWLEPLGLKNHHEFFEIVNAYPQVKVILWGHIHQLFDEVKNNIRYLATPSTCIQFLPKSDTFALDKKHPGYRWLDLYSDGTFKTDIKRLKEFYLTPDETASGY